ncbi:MAG: sigma 54-interacting transcriptional regulator [Candidatus Zixiibacteriota bacterium]|jgi:transcriptional regulator with PAS, ATPase and Fis domain
MSSKVLIYGERLSGKNWEKLCATHPELRDDSLLLREPVLPETATDSKTAFVDLETAQFRNPEFLLSLSKSFDQLRIVGIAESPSIDETVEVAKLGVAEILNLEQFLKRLENGHKMKETPPVPEIPAANADPFSVSSIIGHSPRMLEIKKMIEHLSDVDYPNAIFFGETGTGKDLLAKVMHYSGVRKDKNFIEVNCSAIPDELFESELFGHKKGAFTDAKNDKIGLFEFAHNGTIFLDEVGNLTSSAQAKLLKILENRKLRPLGGVEEKDINVRVLAATNINLEQAVREGRFREDLLFRLNLISIHLPPLRERKEDIFDLALYNFDFYRTLYNKRLLCIRDDALEALQAHNWPGNVRELRNVIERAVLLASTGELTAPMLREAIKNGRVTARERRQITIEIPEAGIPLKAIERQVILEILNMVGWNRTQAASILKISRARLRRIMEENNLRDDRRGTD